MTTRTDRNVASSRGRAIAAPASASRVAALRHNGVAFVYEDDDTVIVERTHRFSLAASHWYRIDDPSVHGYLVATLLADIRGRRASEKPAVGRDSAASASTHVDAVAESTAGYLTADILKGNPGWP